MGMVVFSKMHHFLKQEVESLIDMEFAVLRGDIFINDRDAVLTICINTAKFNFAARLICVGRNWGMFWR